MVVFIREFELLLFVQVSYIRKRVCKSLSVIESEWKESSPSISNLLSCHSFTKISKIVLVVAVFLYRCEVFKYKGHMVVRS